MGYLFECQDKTIWSPSKDVAELLLVEVRFIENRLAAPSGLTEYMSDTVDVDFTILSEYLRLLRGWVNLENRSARLLVKGVVVHLLALLACGDVSPRDVARMFPDDWVVEAQFLARKSMAPAGHEGRAKEDEEGKPSGPS